jgi:hypothetical protein
MNERIMESWQALQPAMEAKEIYDEHYEQLMKDKGIMKCRSGKAAGTWTRCASSRC